MDQIPLWVYVFGGFILGACIIDMALWPFYERKTKEEEVSKSLVHDHAMKLAREVLAIIAPCLREEEQRDAFVEFARVCRKGLEEFEHAKERMESRIKPR